MNKPLIIAEKPSAARAYAQALGGSFAKREGYLESSQYFLTWAVGHLVGLAMPEDYDPLLKKWRLQDLPFIPDAFQLKVLEKTKSQLKIIQGLAKKADSLIVATDAGREGQLIYELIREFLKINLPTKRLWISSLTDEAIREGFRKLRDNLEFSSLYESALCRARGDYLVGINASRAFSVKYNAKLSLGRVQTPVLNLLVSRQEEIENFVPQPFWELEADFNLGYRGKWFTKETDRFSKKEVAEEIGKKVEGEKGIIVKLESKESKENPPLPFDLTTLQRDANKLYGYTAQETLETAQTLYEAKLISYPRTDSRYFTKDLVPELNLIGAKLAAVFTKYAMPIPITPAHRGVNDKKVTDHHAIIPTLELPKGNLGEKERKIYGLVVKRFFVQFYPEAVYREINLVTLVEEETFKTTAKTLVKKGWREIEKAKEEKEIPQEILSLQKGQEVVCSKTEILEKETTPPKPYNEASLLGAMERPKLVKEEGKILDDELLELLKEHGLGTPATRASIIEKLKQVGYIQAKGKTLTPTEKGRELIRLVRAVGVEELASPELTGEWEKKINDIYKKGYPSEQFMKQIKELTKAVVEKAKAGAGAGNFQEEEKEGEIKCFCGRTLINFPKNWACAGYRDESCKFILWKEIAGKILTDKQVASLMSKGETGVLKGFKAKSGKKFDCKLVIRDGKVEFGFANQKPSGLKCPLCGKELREFEKNYSCTGYKEGCNFKLWKEILGKTLTKAQMKGLLENSSSGMIEGFKSKQGKEFNAILVIKDGKVQFNFVG